ncbi:MAG: prepilin-type N-terminal cleavage/methylation domain-containing protein [Verrucomicrobiota bacterium]|jgi:prepilin-type N-terminal cleavage/methylation domain-containing protein
MKLSRPRRSEARRATQRAFSLMELMLSVSIMVVIVGALYAMFYQTQKALRSSVNQVDVLESGRVAMDLLSRELSQMAPTRLANSTNFVAFLTPVYQPVVQRVPVAGNLFRTNRLQEIYFFSRYGQNVSGTCYRVLGANNGVGTLGRFTYITNLAMFRQPVSLLALLAEQQAATNFATIASGVIHFRVLAYDTFGMPLSWPTNRFDTNSVWLLPDANDRLSPAVARETRATFVSNALPAYLDIELGVLEPTTLAQFQSFPAGSPMAATFLSNHIGQVQLFRQRVPIAESAVFYAQYR